MTHIEPLEGEDRQKALKRMAHGLREPWLHEFYVSKVTIQENGDIEVKRADGFTYTWGLKSVEPNGS